jgi:hemoglobin-like flavoprotein
MTLTAADRRLVRTSFDALRDHAEPLGLLFYGKLFELDPSARAMFHVDLREQVRKLMDMLGWVVQSLDDADAMTGPLGALGRQHASYGVRPDQYDTLTAALLFAFAQALGPDFDPATRKAWRAALTAVGQAMQEGAAGV